MYMYNFCFAARRHMAETKQNDRSSRSHCILRVVRTPPRSKYTGCDLHMLSMYFISIHILLLIVDYREQTSRWWISCYGGTSGMIKRPLEPFNLWKSQLCLWNLSFIDSYKMIFSEMSRKLQVKWKKISFDISVLLTIKKSNKTYFSMHFVIFKGHLYQCLVSLSIKGSFDWTKIKDSCSYKKPVISVLQNFVDLAGSEKAGENTGDRFREGCSINKSLFTLARIIAKLSEGVRYNFVSLIYMYEYYLWDWLSVSES